MCKTSHHFWFWSELARAGADVKGRAGVSLSCLTWTMKPRGVRGLNLCCETVKEPEAESEVFLSQGCALSCCRESAVNLVRSGSYTRQPWRDEPKGNEAPHSGAPTTYVSTYLKRYVQLLRQSEPLLTCLSLLLVASWAWDPLLLRAGKKNLQFLILVMLNSVFKIHNFFINLQISGLNLNTLVPIIQVQCFLC